MITTAEYHRYKFHFPAHTTRNQAGNVPHVCSSTYWGNSPHKGDTCHDCEETLDIINFENNMEEIYGDREISIQNCLCH